LETFTNWLHEHKLRGFLGEFAVGADTIGNGPGQIGDEAIDNMLNYMEANDDVWLGWSWWAAGPWFTNYFFSLEPDNLGQFNETDRIQMQVIEPHLVGLDTPGDFDSDGDVDEDDLAKWLADFALNHASDADGDGDSDGADFLAWQRQLGSGSALSTMEAVPEPSAACLLVVASLMICSCSRHWNSVYSCLQVR